MTVGENLQSVFNATSILRSWVIRLLVLVTGLGEVVQAQGFVDAFAVRTDVTGLGGTRTGSNVGATIEEDEPRHGGKSPAKSLWITFVSPASGLMGLEVDGQDFDVLLGVYRVRVDTDDVRFFTEAVEVQMSTEGLSTTLARNKPEDSMESPLVGAGGLRPSPRRQAAPAGDGVSRGYNGSQIFNTVYAGRDPQEPVHCGQGSGASYWFAYQSPESGTVVMDTVGSTFDTVLAAYTYDMPYAGYASLREVGCDDNSGPDGKASVVSFRVSPTRYYVVVVDGVNGAKGRAHLNYRLETNSAPVLVAPRIQQLSPDRVVAQGTPVSLEVVAEGTAPLAYRWFRPAGAPLVTTNNVLELGAVQLPQGGLYQVEISNAAGAVTSAPVGLTVWSDPVLELDGMPGAALVRYGLRGPGSVPVELASEVHGPWTPWTNGVPDAAGIVRLNLDFATEPRRFVRPRIPSLSAASVTHTISP
jgi:hypothetical protein